MKTVRIRTTPNGGDKFLKVNIEQDFDYIEVLSLKLSQQDAYRRFCSDYGVIVGRVSVNNGFGVPNAKISVFIPIDEADADNPVIKGLYPYETVTDKTQEGVRYNLLPKDANGSSNKCHTPVGTHPSKREVLDDPDLSYIDGKYYKFTTTSNYAGDYMIFGVPLGSHVVHMDVDVSDIGYVSQRPYDLITQGSSPKQFTSPTKFRSDVNIDKLPQVKTANVGVNVIPFWGDTDTCEIGLTRLDFDLNHNITPSAIFMGSIFGDQFKNSVNKQCRPRKKMGQLCEQVTGAGTIDIIRRTTNGGIEDYQLAGGYAVDDDGTWAFQLPMNLDHMVTDEYGSLVPSNDPNVGIPTRASVRFRIGMSQTGGEGRLRTRAKYLVPNNPSQAGEIDYSFGEETKDASFRDMYWNKIYTVSNFIPRYQRVISPNATRNMVGIKNVDACAGDKNPFPYNRVSGEINPVFSLFCIFTSIMGFMIYTFNLFLLPIINFMITIVNGIIDFINILGADISRVGYIPCLSIQCPADNGTTFAPGCRAGSQGYQAAAIPITYYCGDPYGHTCNFVDLVGLDDCISFEMAKFLNIYELDFYNDWVNGTLYGYLLKYKKRKNGRERFCEYDCGDFVSDANYSGVDGNGNGIADNDCFNSVLVDGSYPCNGGDCHNSFRLSPTVREGLIKKYDDELYYAATTHNAGFKLFATDIVCLGSVFECDWQGYPFIQPYLVDTTYNIPPDIQEVEENSGTVIETGIVGIGGSSSGLLFEVDCAGIHANSRQVLNARHICEAFVSSDEVVEDDITGSIVSQADGVVGSYEIDEGVGKRVRDSFILMNGQSSPYHFMYMPLDSGFNLTNCDVYSFTKANGSTCQPNTVSNGADYLAFRGYPEAGDDVFSQPSNSLYFYFGLNPNRTALDKMKERFFTDCPSNQPPDFAIETLVVADMDGTSNGSIELTVVGDNEPYTYTVENGSYRLTGVTQAQSSVLINGLSGGRYTIRVVDRYGYGQVKHVLVGGVPDLYCTAYVTKNATSSSISDGEITLTQIGGGVQPYSFSLEDHNGSVIATSTQVNTPFTINGLASDPSHPYTLTVMDANGGTCTTTNLFVGGTPSVSLQSVKVDATCFNGYDGSIQLLVGGAQPPYAVTTSGPNGFYSTSETMTGLTSGVYTTTLLDSLASNSIISTTINSLNPMMAITVDSSTLYRQCDPSVFNIPIIIDNGFAVNTTVYVEYMADMSGTWVQVPVQYITQSSPVTIQIPKTAVVNSIRVRVTNQINGTCHSNTVTIPTGNITLPSVTLNGSITSVNNGNGTYTHTVQAGGGVGVVLGSPYNVGVFTNNQMNMTTVFTDSVGCSVTVSN